MRKAVNCMLGFGLVLLIFIALGSTMVQADVYEYEIDEEYEIDSNGYLQLSSDDAKVIISGSQREKVSVHIYFKRIIKGLYLKKIDNFNIDIINDNGNLIIEEKNDISYTIMMGSINENYIIDIEVPQTIDLKLNGDDDNYKISNIWGSIDMDFDDGHVILNGCKGTDFSFKADDANFDIDKIKGEPYFDIDDGRVNVNHGDLTNLKIISDDSDINLNTSLRDNGNYNITADDGDISFTTQKGGGKFTLKGGRVNTSSDYKLNLSGEEIKIYEREGGNSRVEMSVDDAHIYLD